MPEGHRLGVPTHRKRSNCCPSPQQRGPSWLLPGGQRAGSDRCRYAKPSMIPNAASASMAAINQDWIVDLIA
jgi:hypothetical protein